MYPNELPQCCSVPGKVFILGEYAVLANQPALVAAIGPRFMLSVEGPRNSNASLDEPLPRVPDLEESIFSPLSPVGRLLEWSSHCGLPQLTFRFEDPFESKGGFGASSAQFALAYFALAHLADWDRKWEKVWKLYRELTAGATLPPSGADLISQWRGGVTLFRPTENQCLDVWPLMDWSGLLVFSATRRSPDRKVVTHTHLAEVAKEQGSLVNQPWIAELTQPLETGIAAISAGKTEELGTAMNAYADVLWRAGLETQATHEDRLALGGLPDVLGVKGSGALQSDAILVLLRSGSKNRQAVIEAARERGLELVSEGLPRELGICNHVTGNA